MRYFLLLSLSFLLFSCGQEASQNGVFSGTLPESQGGRLDLIVVAEDALWGDITGEKFIKYFAPQQDGLPQAEPLFTVRQIPPKSFNDLLHRSRNLVIFEEAAEPKMQVREDVFARPQKVITFQAPNATEAAKLIITHHKDLVKLLHDSEMELLQKRITKKPQPLPQALKDHNVSMRIPASFELETEQDNLLVFWNKGLKTDQGIIIYFEPIEAGTALIGDDIIPLRDSLTSIHVPGDREGSYMIVEDYIPPVFENMEIDGQFAIETRGLWRTHGDFMGGAFINYTIFVENNNQRIMLDAFLYAPESKKRNLILELEAILRSIDITN